MGYRVIEEDTVSIADAMVRHDNLKLAKIIFSLLEEF
jgi:hypothetical protein